LEDEDIEIPKPGPNIGLIQAVLDGEAERFNLSAALDLSATQDGLFYWERVIRDGIDSEARAKLEAVIAEP